MRSDPIIDLTKQAVNIYSTLDPANALPPYNMKFNMIFADLLIKKCIDIIDETRNNAIDGEWNIDEAMSSAMYNIEEYFGVE